MQVRGTEEEEAVARWKTFCVVNLNTYMESVVDTMLEKANRQTYFYIKIYLRLLFFPPVFKIAEYIPLCGFKIITSVKELISALSSSRAVYNKAIFHMS